MVTVEDLLEKLPGYGNLSERQLLSAKDQSLIPDNQGHLPGHKDYVTTVDPYFAAFLLLGFLEAQPMVTATASEGTSVSATPPNWGALRRYYRAMSPILSMQNDVLTYVPIPDIPHVVRTDMRSGDRNVYRK